MNEGNESISGDESIDESLNDEEATALSEKGKKEGMSPVEYVKRLIGVTIGMPYKMAKAYGPVLGEYINSISNVGSGAFKGGKKKEEIVDETI